MLTIKKHNNSLENNRKKKRTAEGTAHRKGEDRNAPILAVER